MELIKDIFLIGVTIYNLLFAIMWNTKTIYDIICKVMYWILTFIGIFIIYDKFLK